VCGARLATRSFKTTGRNLGVYNQPTTTSCANILLHVAHKLPHDCTLIPCPGRYLRNLNSLACNADHNLFAPHPQVPCPLRHRKSTRIKMLENLLESDSSKIYSNRVAFNYHGISRRYPPLLIFLARRSGSRVTHMMQPGTMTRKFKIGKFDFSDFRGRQSRLLESGSRAQHSPPTSAPIVPHTRSGMHNLSWHH